MIDKKYLIAGATGFLGKYIVSSIPEGCFDSIGRSNKNSISYDFYHEKHPLILKHSYENLIIATGRAHVRKHHADEEQLSDLANYRSVKILIEAIDKSKLQGVVFVSTVAVYGFNSGVEIKEDTALAGETPYAKSKIKAESFLREWSNEVGIPVLILRVPLIVGKNPPGNLGQMISALKKGFYFSVAGGKARRSMVLAEDIARLIIDNCGSNGTFNLADGKHPSYRELESVICKQLNRPISRNIPLFIAKCLASIGDVISFFPLNSDKLEKLIHDYIIDDSKARRELNWNPRSVVNHFKIE
ncbi:MAG: NAD-dependent epimerase/dehydratase family protein [Sphingobacteriaceae bacterium]|nr:NAD-dependent epimerase/dehydratase family protein [Sphingobacteriaceae bacterium]